MYYSAGCVQKTVLLTVHLDPRERTYQHGLCPVTSSGWSCRYKGHQPPWGPPALHWGAQATYWGVFSEVLPAGLWIMGALSNRLQVFCHLRCHQSVQVCSHPCSASEAPGHGAGQPWWAQAVPAPASAEEDVVAGRRQHVERLSVCCEVFPWLVQEHEVHPVGNPAVLWSNLHPVC